MSYRILMLRRAQRELGDIPRDAYPRVKEAIGALTTEPRPRHAAKLSSRDGWRMRVGDYRAIYDIDDNARTVTVLHVGHRRDVYR